MSWFIAMFSAELKKMFSYRVDFWVQFFVGIGVEIGIAYFLWSALFAIDNTHEISGYSLPMMILYSVYAAFGGRIVRGNERMIVASDIYDGGLTKYLLYPINYLLVSFSQAVAFNTVTVFQMALGLAIFFAIFGIPAEYNLTFANLFMGTTACLVASIFYFIMYVTIDYAAFWVDTVWGLSVMVRFVAQFMSGLFIPLEMFPDSFRKVVYQTPFPYIGAEPVKMFLGRSNWGEWVHTNLMIVIWTIPLAIIMQIVWRRGLRNYTGVGI